MTEKRFTAIRKRNPVTKDMGNYIQDNGTTILKLGFLEDCKDVCELLNEQHEQIQKYKRYFDIPVKDDGSSMNIRELLEENEQLKQQLQIFEKFLEGNDLSIDWEEFCGLEECAFENPNFSCKTCIHLKGDV